MTPLLIATALIVSPIQTATHHGPHQAAAQTIEQPAPAADAPRLILLEPRPDFLEKGYVFLPFRVENLTLLPLYAEIHGEEVLKLNLRIGHLHVRVGDSEWSWIHASTDPIYFSPLSPGVHQVRIELVDAAHTLIEAQTLELIVP